MQTPLEIHAQDFSLTDAIRTEIEEKVSKLEEHAQLIIACRVHVSAPGTSHHRKGGPFAVSFDIKVPGHELVAKREGDDLYMAIRDCYRAARRQLEDTGQKRRRETKLHVHHPHGRVLRLVDDHGYIGTADGREIYFHRNSLISTAFDRLQVGDEVSYVEEPGDKGARASAVMPGSGPNLAEEMVTRSS